MITVAVLIVASILGTGPASANGQRHEQVRVVASFDPSKGQNPENLAVAPDGTIYVTWLFAHSIVAIRADAGQSVVTIGGPGDEVSGVAIDPVHPDRLAVGVISKNVATSGIWSVPFGAFHGHGTPTRSVALPVSAFVNGLTYAGDGTLYVADSIRGLILQVPRGSSSAVTWLSAGVLTPTGATFQGVPLPGVNGIKLHRGAMYATNTARGLLLRIPIRHHTAGIPVIAKAGLAFDDFVIDEDGVVTAALNISDQVVRFTPAGPVVVIADKAHDDVENPSAVAVGPHHELLITSSAYFGTHPALQAADQRFQR